jgi:hypothetical protein
MYYVLQHVLKRRLLCGLQGVNAGSKVQGATLGVNAGSTGKNARDSK